MGKNSSLPARKKLFLTVGWCLCLVVNFQLCLQTEPFLPANAMHNLSVELRQKQAIGVPDIASKLQNAF